MRVLFVVVVLGVIFVFVFFLINYFPLPIISARVLSGFCFSQLLCIHVLISTVYQLPFYIMTVFLSAAFLCGADVQVRRLCQ